VRAVRYALPCMSSSELLCSMYNSQENIAILNVHVQVSALTAVHCSTSKEQYVCFCCSAGNYVIERYGLSCLTGLVGCEFSRGCKPDTLCCKYCMSIRRCGFCKHCLCICVVTFTRIASLRDSYRARQLYKNISMLFLFPVKDGKLITGVNATFRPNASFYG